MKSILRKQYIYKEPYDLISSDFEKSLLREFKRLDDYLNTPLLDEIDPDSHEEFTVSRRLFLDGDHMTLADCSLLPKLNIIKVSIGNTAQERSCQHDVQ